MSAEITAALEDARPKGFEVWPENMPIVDAWLAIASQWRTVALADGRVHWIGLDYAAAKAGLELAAITVTGSLWAGVCAMERAASAALNGVRG